MMISIREQDLPYEDLYLGYNINIEPNPDRYREGFEWSISKDDIQHNSGVEFDVELALEASRKAVEEIVN